MVQPLWRTVWRFLKKLKIDLLYDPVIPPMGIYLEKTIIEKIHAHSDKIKKEGKKRVDYIVNSRAGCT